MANKGQENLIPMNERSKDEVRELGQKGGIRSGEVRREKATFKKTLEMLLDEKNNKGKTYRELITLGQIKSAIDGKAENFKTILALMGEIEEEQASTPELKIEIVNNEDLEAVMYDKDNDKS